MNEAPLKNAPGKKIEIKKVITALKKCNNFIITSHINPEGDSIGSKLAMYLMLKQLKKNAIMVDHDTIPENLKFLSGVDLISREIPADFTPETVIVLDCPVKSRTGDTLKTLAPDIFTINIDHHISNEFFGDVNWVEEKLSSVGEMLFYLAKKMRIRITKETAYAIYASIVTDTGMFNYETTTSETHRAVAELIANGVMPKLVYREIFEQKSLAEIRLLATVMSTVKIEEAGKVAHLTLTNDMFRNEGVTEIPTDEFINYARSIRGVEIAVFFKENPNGEKKISVSFRSNGESNVNTIAACFGGGGHPKASGCTFQGITLEEARTRVLTKIHEALINQHP